MLHPRSVSKRRESIEDLIDPTIRRVNIVLSDEIPDLVEIERPGDTQNVLTHALIFLRACDLPLIRSRAAAGCTCSPRSKDASLWPSSWLNAAICALRAWSCSSRSRSASRTTSLAEL
jgi:hypothetical protein